PGPARNLKIPIASRLYHLSRGGGRPAAREVGTVKAITPAGHVTVRAFGPDVVPEGTNVTDARGVLHGRVVRVFGPVSRPYLSVRSRRPPTPAEGLALLDATLVRE
ncbi:MAG: H/ACA ribonucleoprotein complex subunit GAR1, partial [Thermoplasmata archaeon]